MRRERESIKEPAELLRGDVHDLGHVLWPAKAMLLKTFEPEAESVAVPIQNLERITLAVAEDEKVAGERV